MKQQIVGEILLQEFRSACEHTEDRELSELPDIEISPQSNQS